MSLPNIPVKKQGFLGPSPNPEKKQGKKGPSPNPEYEM